MTGENAVTAEASVTSKNLSKITLLKVAQYPFIALFAFLVPRIMGADAYGRYALFVSWVGIMSAVLDLAISEISARAIPEFQRQKDREGIVVYFSRMLGFKVTVDLAFVAVCGVGLLVAGARFGIRQFAWPILLTVFVSDIGGAAYGMLFGLNRLVACSARDPIRRGASLAIVILLFSKFGLGGAIFSVVLVEAISALVNLIWTRRYISPRHMMPKLSYVSPLLRYGLLFYFSWAVLTLWQRLGDTLIGYLRSDFGLVALFDLSNQIFLTATSFTLFVISSLAPIFTRLRLEGKEGKLVDWSRRILTYSQIACMVLLAVWVLLGRELVPVLIGRQYAGLYPIVTLLLCGTFPMVIVQLGLALAMAYAEPVWYLLALSGAIVGFMAAAFAFIPSYGAMGCAAATLISCVLCALIMAGRFRDNLRQSLPRAIKAIAIGAVLLVSCWLFRGGWHRDALLLVAFLAVYAGVLWILRVLDREEIRQAWLALRSKQAPDQLLGADSL